MNNPLVQPDPGLFIWTILTFLVLLYLLAKFAWKPLLGMLEKRENLIRQSLADAEKARAELEKIQSESEALLAQARDEAQTIVKNGKDTAERMKADIVAAAEEKARQLKLDAEAQISAARDQALAEIKAEVVDLSVDIARKLIRKNLTAQDNQELIDQSLQQMKPKHEA
ncbi:MAG: ATP synthase F0 subunit B [Candidatus Neomarinimicrobiota bacterium]|nr:MAG: ATP synthase F0 subunit B [Candidatus Neomarinimicrobiota bacterium]